MDDERIHDINSFELINAGRQPQNDDADLDEDEPEVTGDQDQIDDLGLTLGVDVSQMSLTPRM